MRRSFELGAVGSGYAGLVTRACVADVEDGRVADLRARSLPLYEPGFEELREGSVRRSTSRKRRLLAMERIGRVKSRGPGILAGKEAS